MNENPYQDEGFDENFVQPMKKFEPSDMGQRLTLAGIGASAEGLAVLQGFFDAFLRRFVGGFA